MHYNAPNPAPFSLWHHQLTPSAPLQNTLPAHSQLLAQHWESSRQRRTKIAPRRVITRLEQEDSASKFMWIDLNFPPLCCMSAPCRYWSHQTGQHSWQITHMGVSPINSRSKTTSMKQEKQVQSMILTLYTKLTSFIKADSLHTDILLQFFMSGLVCCSSWSAAFVGVKQMMHEFELVNHHSMCNSSNPYPCAIMSTVGLVKQRNSSSHFRDSVYLSGF